MVYHNEQKALNWNNSHKWIQTPSLETNISVENTLQLKHMNTVGLVHSSWTNTNKR